MYKFHFYLGDYWQDGHGHYQYYLIESNYSAEEIDEAYKKVTDLIGFDYCETICSEYEDSRIYPHFVTILENFGIDLKKYQSEYYDEEYTLDKDTYIALFFDLIKLVLKDIEYKYIEDPTPELHCIDGTGYGLFFD